MDAGSASNGSRVDASSQRMGAAAMGVDAGRTCLPKDAPADSYCDDDVVELEGTVEKKVAFASDGIAAHGKVEHAVWVLVLDRELRLYVSGSPITSKRVQLNAQVKSEKPWTSIAPGARAKARGHLFEATRPHEVEPIVMWGGDRPPQVSAVTR